MACRFFASLSLAAATILSGCITSGDRSGQTSIQRNFSVGGYRWADGGTVYVFVGVRPNSGRVEVCAARMATKAPAFTRGVNDSVLAAASVRVGGDRVLTGLAFANSLPETDDVVGKPANCVITGKPWKPAYADAKIEVDVPRQRFTG